MLNISQIWDNFCAISLQVLTKKRQITRSYIKINTYSKPEVYLEHWFIQKSGTLITRDIWRVFFRTLWYSEHTYSEPCQTPMI